MSNSRQYQFKRKTGNTLLLACGALAKDLVRVIEANRLTHLDIQCLPAQLHHRPQLIPAALREKIRENRNKYSKIFVVYGDCGTAGEIDRVLEQEGGIERIPGPHCFSFYWGNDDFEAYGKSEVTAFYLSEFFCRFFDKFIWEAFALDRDPGMVDFVFAHYEKLVYMPQTKDPLLEEKAREIARRLKLKYEYRFCGFGDLEIELKRVQAMSQAK